MVRCCDAGSLWGITACSLSRNACFTVPHLASRVLPSACRWRVVTYIAFLLSCDYFLPRWLSEVPKILTVLQACDACTPVMLILLFHKPRGFNVSVYLVSVANARYPHCHQSSSLPCTHERYGYERRGVETRWATLECIS